MCCSPVAVASATAAGHGAYHTLRRHLADGIVAGVGHEQVAGTVDRKTGRGMESGRTARAIGERLCAARQHRHGAIGGDFLDAVLLAGVGYVHIAGAVEHNPERIAEATSYFADGGRPAHHGGVHFRGEDSQL